MATKTDGTLWIWGANNYGELGVNDVVYRSSPTQVPGTNWHTVSFGYNNTFASKTDGTLWVWGSNVNGQLGLNQAVSISYSSPVQVPGNWSRNTIITSKMSSFGIK